MMTAKEIRDSFKSFFESKGHQIVPSAPMVIKDDPTLMFTNAGMNQFKDIILGNHPAKYKYRNRNNRPKYPSITHKQKLLINFY
jgi:alanyl-tRNA synthetase